MRKTLYLGAGLVVAFFAVQQLTSGGETESPGAAVEAIAAGALVVDARTAGEYAGGHVAGAVHANVLGRDFRERVDAYDRDQTVYVYCASGTRSGRAASVLKDMGFARVVNAGGLGDLAAAGAEVER